MTERVLILGGAGFIGSHLAAHCVRRGDEVHIGVRPGWIRGTNAILPDVPATAADLGEPEQIEDVFAAARPTVVYHLATATRKRGVTSEDSAGDWLEDVRNLQRILDVARRYRPGIKAFVRAGSLAEYGNAKAPSQEDEREEPVTLYALALAMGTHALRTLGRNLPFRTATARLGLTYGPGQDESFLVSSLLRACLSGEACLVREPSVRRDMIHVDDVVRGLFAIPRAQVPAGAIINLCTGVAQTARRIAETVCSVTGADPQRLTFGPEQAGASVVWGSTARARELIGFSARYALAEGLEKTVQDMMAGSR